jgi:16S rRNA (guanine966-N2)-methyltransferase
VLVEADRRAVAVVRDNVASLGVGDRVRVVHSDAILALERGALSGPWDLVLADPPYGSGSGGGLLRSLVAASVLAPGAVVVVESDATDPAPEGPPPLLKGRRARYGRVALDFLHFPDSRESW